MRQRDLFLEWSLTCKELQNLNRFFQNDLSKMKHDGEIEDEKLFEDLIEFGNKFNTLRTRLTMLSIEVQNLYRSVGNKEDGGYTGVNEDEYVDEEEYYEEESEKDINEMVMDNMYPEGYDPDVDGDLVKED